MHRTLIAPVMYVLVCSGKGCQTTFVASCSDGVPFGSTGVFMSSNQSTTKNLGETGFEWLLTQRGFSFVDEHNLEKKITVRSTRPDWTLRRPAHKCCQLKGSLQHFGEFLRG